MSNKEFIDGYIEEEMQKRRQGKLEDKGYVNIVDKIEHVVKEGREGKIEGLVLLAKTDEDDFVVVNCASTPDIGLTLIGMMQCQASMLADNYNETRERMRQAEFLDDLLKKGFTHDEAFKKAVDEILGGFRSFRTKQGPEAGSTHA
jgi:hypothetical protein